MGRVVFYTFVGAMAILFIMNADKFKTAGGTIESIWVHETQALSGSGYVMPR